MQPLGDSQSNDRVASKKALSHRLMPPKSRAQKQATISTTRAPLTPTDTSRHIKTVHSSFTNAPLSTSTRQLYPRYNRPRRSFGNLIKFHVRSAFSIQRRAIKLDRVSAIACITLTGIFKKNEAHLSRATLFEGVRDDRRDIVQKPRR